MTNTWTMMTAMIKVTMIKNKSCYRWPAINPDVHWPFHPKHLCNRSSQLVLVLMMIQSYDDHIIIWWSSYMMIFNTSSSIILVDLSLSCKNYIQYKCSPTSHAINVNMSNRKSFSMNTNTNTKTPRNTIPKALCNVCEHLKLCACISERAYLQ